MAKLDQAKEFIGFLKVIFTLLVVIDSSLIAWLFKFPDLNMQSSVVIFGIIIASVTIILLVKYILNKISELEDL